MGVGSGLATSVGYAEESTWATGATVTRFPRHTGCTLKWDPKSVQGEGIQAGTYAPSGSLRGRVSEIVGGDVMHDFTSKEMGLLLKHAMGSISTAQNGSTAAYTHTATEGNSINGKGLTIQVGMAQTTGTIVPYTYTGCKIASWQLACAQNDLLKYQHTVTGQTMTTGTALATPSYVTSSNVFTFKMGTLSVGGTPYYAMKDFTLACDNQITGDQRTYIGRGGKIDEPIRNALATVKLTGGLDYIDDTIANAMVADTELSAVLTFTGKQIVTGSPNYYEQLVITLNGLRLNDSLPVMNGADLLNIGLDADATNPIAGGTRLSLAYTTLDTTP